MAPLRGILVFAMSVAMRAPASASPASPQGAGPQAAATNAAARQVSPRRATSSRGAARYNVLFLAVDDLRPELGCAGVPDARTPHLDRLAAQGLRFDRHYVQVPTCGASRYALLTGRSPARSGALGNGALYQGRTAIPAEEQEGARTLPELFRRNAYHTVCLGKISHTPDGKVFSYKGTGDGRPELPGAWDELPTQYGAWQRGWGIFFAYAGGHHREDGQGHRALMEFTAERDEDLPDGMLAAQAIESLRGFAESGQRFFLGVGFFKPHLPFVATRGDWEAMQQVDVQPPPHSERPVSAYWHQSGEFYGYRAAHEKTRPLAPEARIECRRAYLACVRYVDRQVGRVLSALDEMQLAEDTLVVLWGDHGWHLGESAMWGKHSLFERSLRSALILRVPGMEQTGDAGRASDALVETLDLYPTLVELCALPDARTQHPLDGHSLVPLLHGEADAVREAALSYQPGRVSVRTATHRLIAKQKDGEVQDVELYDLRDGEDPVRNRAAEEAPLVLRMLAHRVQKEERPR